MHNSDFRNKVSVCLYVLYLMMLAAISLIGFKTQWLLTGNVLYRGIFCMTFWQKSSTFLSSFLEYELHKGYMNIFERIKDVLRMRKICYKCNKKDVWEITWTEKHYNVATGRFPFKGSLGFDICCLNQKWLLQLGQQFPVGMCTTFCHRLHEDDSQWDLTTYEKMSHSETLLSSYAK